MSLNLTYAIGAGHGRPEVRQDFDDITAWANSLDETDLSTSSGLFAAYRTLKAVQGALRGSAVATTYFFTGSAPTINSIAYTGVAPSGVSTLTGEIVIPEAIYFDDADYTMAGKTQKLRVRAQAYTNAVAPATTFTAGLYPISSVAGSGATVIVFTLGTVVSGSTVAFAAPSASTLNTGSSGDFTIPADGHYVLGVVAAGSPAATSCTALAAQLQTRWT